MSEFFCRPWDSQPQEAARIDWSNPLTRGLVSFVHQNNGALRDSVADNGSSTNTASATPTSRGISTLYNNTQTQFAHRPSLEILGDISIAVWLDITALTNYGGLVSKGSGGAANQPYELRLSTGATDGRLEFLRAGSSGFQSLVGSTTTAVVGTGKNQCIIVSAPQLVNTGGTFYINGAPLIGTRVGSSTPNPTGTNGPLYIGKRADGVTYLNGSILAVAIYNRRLSNAEALALTPNPWQLFEPQRIFTPVAAGGGALPTLSLPTYVPGSLTSVGFRPRVTAT